MKNFTFKLISLFILFTSIVSCSDKEIHEGIIEFEISYPVKNYDSFMSKLMPKKMKMTFKNNIYKNEVTMGNFFSSSIIADCNKKEMIMILNLPPNKIYTCLNEEETREMLKLYPTPDLITSKNMDTVLSVFCAKYYGIYENLEDGHDVELLECKNIKISNSNWCNQYNALNGVLLGYEVSQFGLNMKFKAISIDTESEIPDDFFDIPEKHQKVSLEMFMYKMEEIFSNFLI